MFGEVGKNSVGLKLKTGGVDLKTILKKFQKSPRFLSVLLHI